MNQMESPEQTSLTFLSHLSTFLEQHTEQTSEKPATAKETISFDADRETLVSTC